MGAEAWGSASFEPLWDVKLRTGVALMRHSRTRGNQRKEDRPEGSSPKAVAIGMWMPGDRLGAGAWHPRGTSVPS